MADSDRVNAATEYLERLLSLADEVARKAIDGLVSDVVAKVNDDAVTAAAETHPDEFNDVPALWAQQVEALMMPMTELAYQSGTVNAMVQLPAAMEAYGATLAVEELPRVVNPLIIEHMAAARMQFAAVGPEATARIQAALLEGVREGDSAVALATRVEDASRLSEARAIVIARTEAVRASNAGAMAQARILQPYVPATKEWLDTSDGRTRPTHREAGGQDVALDAKFEVGGAYLDFPGDPLGPPQETINCRCTVLFNEAERPRDLAAVPDPESLVDTLGYSDDVTSLIRSPSDVTAAAGPPQVDSTTGEEHTGAMIALVPSAADRERLPIEGGEEADSLHVTLAYLGEAADMPGQVVDSLKQTLSELAGSLPVLDVEGFGVAVWNKSFADRDTSINMSVGGDMLEETHGLAWDTIETASKGTDWQPPENHAPWVAHLCLAYSDDESLLALAHDREGPLTLDALRLAIGGEAFDFALADAGGDMPYHISQDVADCDGYAVVKDDDGEVMGCHDTEQDAQDQMAALYANEPDAAMADGEMNNRWHGTLLLLNTDSDDGREFRSLEVRDLPIPLMREVKSSHGGFTSETVYVGNIDRVEIHGNEVLGWGDFDMGNPDGAESQRLLTEGRFRHVSIDGGGVKEADIEFVYPDGFDEDGMDSEGNFAMPEKTIYHRAVLLGATQVPFPAFGQAEIALDNESIPTSGTPATGSDEEALSLVASGFPIDPPPEWFEDPKLSGPTPFTVDDSGRIYGHLALWGTCHTGMDKVCRTPPVEASYDYFETGELVAAGGDRFPVGQITLGTGHAPSHLKQFAAAEHYDNTGAAVADVRCGRDDHGIWVAGAARPCVDGVQLRELRAATLSGDWRRFGGQMRLVAALAVNVPGFPVPRNSVMVASGEQTALVAAGVVDRRPARQQRSPRDRIAERIAASIGRSRKDRVRELVDRIGR